MMSARQAQQGTVAVVGAGVAGLTAAWLLQRKYRVDLYERNAYAGGHTRTVVLHEGPDKGMPVDMGFIVMNQRSYPLLTRIFEQLGVPLGDSDMSFGYRCAATGYTYAGTGPAALFAQPANVFRRDHWRMLSDILRFNRAATRAVQEGTLNGQTLGRYLEDGGYGKAFTDHYLVAMGSAIWSAPQREMLDFPVEPFLRFFFNHGLLSLGDRPPWRYVRGGGRTYVKAMLRDLEGSVHLGAAPASVRRGTDGATLRWPDGREKRYAKVVLATHADEALALLDDPSDLERSLLGAWRYQPNSTVLHTDASVMPGARRAWASWNFLRPAQADPDHPVSVTYHMNRLQRLSSKTQYFVSLNLDALIPEARRLDATVFTHPVYSFESLATQSRLKALNGQDHTWFCGSYFGYGFHEDAARSAVEAAEQMGVSL
jgi:predicted NAD/FAD-binding protein